MKIRLDFVTNSSSSSFTCVAMYSEDLYNYLQKLIGEKKYRKQHGWNSRPQDELHIDWAWEELSFDDRWFKVQTTEEYGGTDKQSVYDYICCFFDGLTFEEKDTINKLVSEVYKNKNYQTKKYKDATDGFIGFNFDGPSSNKKAVTKTKEEKQGNETLSGEYAGKVFVTTGLEKADEDLVKQTIEKKGGTFKTNFVVGIDCLVINPDYSHETTKLKKTKELIEKGKNVDIITFHDFCKKENIKVEDRLPYQNPFYDIYKQREIDINEIDIDGKMIDLYALEHCKNRDDEKNLHYGNYGTAIDVAEAIIERYGGQIGHLGYPTIDYVIVSKQMPLPQDSENNKSVLRDMYMRYCSIEQNRGEAFLKKEEKRQNSGLPEIKIIFEDEFHKWLEKQYDKLMEEGSL